MHLRVHESLQDEDPNVVCPKSEILKVMMDPTPYSRSYVDALSVHTKGDRRYP
jgi:hypothetical protein